MEFKTLILTIEEYQMLREIVACVMYAKNKELFKQVCDKLEIEYREEGEQ